MATKSKQIKKIKSSKTAPKKVAATVTEEVEEMLDITPAKSKKPIDLELPDPVIDIEEKVDPEIALETEEEDEESLSIDEEDINPFGDKWEM